jgi:hypothetical protein
VLGTRAEAELASGSDTVGGRALMWRPEVEDGPTDMEGGDRGAGGHAGAVDGQAEVEAAARLHTAATAGPKGGRDGGRAWAASMVGGGGECGN